MGASGENDSGAHKFILHWMNNKEMEFTCQAVKVMEDMFRYNRMIILHRGFFDALLYLTQELLRNQILVF